MTRNWIVMFFRAALILLLAAALTTAQDLSNKNNIGLPPNGVFDGSSFDNVQLNNGNLHIEIPVTSYPGRGLSVGLKYVYDNKGWYIATHCHHLGFCLSDVRREDDNNMVLHMVNTQTFGYRFKFVNQECSGVPYQTRASRTIRESDGTKHHMLPDPAVAGGNTCWGDLNAPAYAEDGSGWALISGMAHRKDGTALVNGMEDPNGNQISSSGSSGPITDTLGRTVALDGSYFDASGVQRQIQVTTTAVPISTQLCEFDPGSESCDEFTGGWAAPQQITLPNGRKYTFTYEQNQYGEPSSVTLPTGGQISWTWGPPDSAGRRVASRTVTVDGQSAITTYGPGGVVDALGNATTYTCTFLKAGFNDASVVESLAVCHFTDMRQYQGSAATGTLLKTTHTDYTGQWNSTRPGTILPIRETTTWAQGNLVTKVETDYDALNVWSGVVTWNNPTERREYAFATGAPGPLVRTTSTAYLHQLNTTYRNANIADRVVDQVVKDGAGNIKANTHTIYDETDSLIASLQNAPNHNSAKGTSYFLRGNPTRVQRWLNTTGAWLTTRNVYDDLGNLRSTTDSGPNGGHTTSFNYSDSWWANTACVPAGVNTQAYVTQTTNALGQASTTKFYPCTGQVGHSRDPNDIANSRDGTKRTYDLMNRPIQIDYPDGGQTKFAYGDTSSQFWIQQDTLLKTSGTGNPGTCAGDRWSTSWTEFDGVGRVKRTAKCNGAPSPNIVDQVDTCYDLLGRKSYVSNPFQGAGFITAPYFCDNSQRPGETFGYDALSRPTQLTRTDNGTVTTTYPAGNQAIVTDEAGKKRKSETDALGRLVKVWEPDSAGSFVYETLYQYDTLDNLTRVDQKGNDSNSANWRTRTFQYDSLSRLTSAGNPESGTITFTYDDDGNLLTKTAPAPNQTGSSTVTTTFAYDQLHRLFKKTYSNGPAIQHFDYDTTPAWSPALTNTIGRRVAAYNRLIAAGPAIATVTSYDAMGRPLFEKHWNDRASSAPPQQFTYEYNVDGSLKSLTYPSSRKLDYTYNLGQRATSMVDTANSTNYATNATYTAWGAPASYTNGTVSGGFAGIKTQFVYNLRMQPDKIVAMTGTPDPNNCAAVSGKIFHVAYAYNLFAGNNGNVTGIFNCRNADRSQLFTYDELNRVATAKTTSTTGQYCWGESLGYDIWANLTSRGVLAGYTGCTGEGDVPAATVKNQMATHTYDAAGNHWPTGHSYNAENMLVAASGGMSFDYDADGRRAKKTNGSTGTLYWYGSGGEVLQETDLAGVLKREFVYFNGKRTARRDASSGNVHYYFSDHLGSSNVVTDATGGIKEESDFYPFGGERVVTNLLPDQDYKFTGKERDSETNLDYFGARYYSFNFGRFITPDEFEGGPDDLFGPDADVDPLPYADLRNPQSLNKYGYAYNNPLRYIDPDGHAPTTGTETFTPEEIAEGARRLIESAKPASPLLAPLAVAAAYGVAIGGATYFLLDSISQRIEAEAQERWQTQLALNDLAIRRVQQAQMAHRRGARKSTKGKHQRGTSRKKRDRGGEKGDWRWPRKRPDDWDKRGGGPWPPKKPFPGKRQDLNPPIDPKGPRPGNEPPEEK